VDAAATAADQGVGAGTEGPPRARPSGTPIVSGVPDAWVAVALSAVAAGQLMMWPREERPMGERARGKDKGKSKKSPKAAKTGRRPHELQQQLRDALKRPTETAS
jgi:hypothetical protein